MVRPAIGFITWRVGALIVVHVNFGGDTQLPEIVQARNTAAGFLRAGQDRQQHGGQNRNDGDDHQQFNQVKPFFTLVFCRRLVNFITIPFVGASDWMIRRTKCSSCSFLIYFMTKKNSFLIVICSSWPASMSPASPSGSDRRRFIFRTPSAPARRPLRCWHSDLAGLRVD